MTLCTQADLEAVLQIDVTSEPDSRVTTLIELAQGLIEQAAGRNLEIAAVTAETFSADHTRRLFLENYPIQTITEVRVDGSALAAADYKVSADTGVLHRMSGTYPILWEPGVEHIEVDYTGGYPTTHPTFRAARALCVDVVARVFRQGAVFANGPGDDIRRIQLEGSDEIEYHDRVVESGSGMQLTADEYARAIALTGPRIA